MPKLLNRNPKYRLHKASGNAIVTINGRDIYLGQHGTPGSRAEYDCVVAEWLTNGRRLVDADDAGSITVSQVIAAFWTHADAYYRRPDGTPTREAGLFRDCLGPVRRLYGPTPAVKFGPLALKAVAQEMVRLSGCRTNINKQLGRVRHVWKWAAANEMLPASLYEALRVAPGLRAGKTQARESEPVKPVAEQNVIAVLPHLSRTVRAMVKLQALTGARPGELCILRGCDVDTTSQPWIYRPESHKTSHRGHTRTIPLGPKAQAVLAPLLKPDITAYVFSPAESPPVVARTTCSPSCIRRRPSASAPSHSNGHITAAQVSTHRLVT